jgi:hypothetical protein
MTLDRPIKNVAKIAFDVDVVPDDITLALEDDEQLIHLCEALESLDYAQRCKSDDLNTVDAADERRAVLDLATQRAETLALEACVHPAVDDSEGDRDE